jgi:hypothetical protein
MGDGSPNRLQDAGPRIGVAAPAARPRSGRRGPVNILVGIATILLVVGIFVTWANRLLFSPDAWSNTSTQLLQSPKVRAATANYIVDQIDAHVHIPRLLDSGLPSQLRGLAPSASDALRDAAVQGVELALKEPQVQAAWAEANRAAARALVTVVNGGSGGVDTRQGLVTLHLGATADRAASQLGLGRGLTSRLPANMADLTVFRSDQLLFVQDVGKAIRGLALLLTILVPFLYVLAIMLTPGRRRRTLMTIGFSWVLAGVAVLLLRVVIGSQVAGALTDNASLQVTIRDVFSIATTTVGHVAGVVIAVGGVLILAAWFAGPARAARFARQAIPPRANTSVRG